MLTRIIEWIVRREGRSFTRLDRVDGWRNPPEPREDIHLYVHMPFCRRPCPFCSFNRYPYVREKAVSYVKSLKKEIEMYASADFDFSVLYVGGGTPTVDMELLADVLDKLRSTFSLREISVEANPNDINDESIETLRSCRVDRLSIGVQSFSDRILREIGRLSHTGEDAIRSISLAEGRFRTLNVDLIFGLPNQSMEDLRRDLQIVKELRVDQVTFYPLMPSPHKRNALERRFNKVRIEKEREYYLEILRQMRSGYRPSTVWCFSRGDHMIDEYIVRCDDYIGMGSGSMSLLGSRYYVNSFSLERYSRFVERGLFPVVFERELRPRELAGYHFLTRIFGLETDDREEYKVLRKELALLRLFGIIERRDGRLRVTERGMYPMSVAMREFFSCLNSLRELCIENQI